MVSRRDFARLLLGGAALAAGGASAFAQGRKIDSTVAGVRLGVCLYNFRDLPRPADQQAYIDLLIDACVRSGGGLVEVNSNYLEPRNDLPFAGIPRIQDWQPKPAPGAPTPKWMTMPREELLAQREALRRWRIDTPASYHEGVRRKIEAAGLAPYSFVITFTPDMTDEEIDAVFRQARSLGVSVFSTNQTKVELGPRLVPFADRYGMEIGFHNHTQVLNPNEVAAPDTFERLFALSPRFKANLDVGHYTAANLDALDFLKRFPDRITHLHMKDRKRNEGPGTVWGEGDAPLREMLLTIRDRRLPIPCIVEYEYRGAGTSVEETIRCLDYMRRVLRS